jgi:hypothetical protein
MQFMVDNAKTPLKINKKLEKKINLAVYMDIYILLYTTHLRKNRRSDFHS